MTKRSASAEALADASPASWSDAGIERASGVERLSPEQPDRGLLWVTRGSLTLTRAGRVHEVRKGTVIAYRVGGGLTWSAAEGTHVRWCSREVGVGPGQVAPWTSELSLDGPVLAAPRRRPLYVVSLVVAAWIFAIGVAWCYGSAHSAWFQKDVGTLAGARSPEFPGRSDAETTRSIFLAHGLAVDVDAAPNGRRLIVYAEVPPEAELPYRLTAARDATDETYQACGRLQGISVAFSSGGRRPEELERFFLLPPEGGAIDLNAPAGAAAPVKSAAARSRADLGRAAEERRQR